MNSKTSNLKRTTAIFFLVIFAFSSFSPVFSANSASNANAITFTATIPAPTISKTMDYDDVRIEGFGVTSEVGKPKLPVKILPVLLPPDAEVLAIEVTSTQEEALAGSFKVLPAQLPALEGQELPPFVEPDPEVYGSDKPYPGVLFEDDGVQWFQGYKILNIRVFPVEYTPSDGIVTHYSSIGFKVTYRSTDEVPTVGRTDVATRDAVAEIVVNPEAVDEWVAEPVQPQPIYIITRYVIITSPALTDTFQRLADWKNHRDTGWAAVFNTTWIYNRYTGVDGAAKIRNFIADMWYNAWTNYVLLAGDYNVVPTRFVYDDNSPTDYYYACLGGNWDPDGDGKYLEPGENIPDFYPEVYVGRVPVTYAYQANIVIDKIISYERTPPSGGWRQTAVMAGAISNYAGESPYGKTDNAKECDYVMDDFLTPKGYSTTTLYEKEGLSPSTWPSTYPLSIDNMDMVMGWGSLILGTASHGAEQEADRKVWMWDDGDGVSESFEMYWTPFMDTKMTLTNDGKLPLVYMEACLCGAFDYTYDSVAEWLLKMENGGAIGVVAASRVSWYMIGWDKGDGLNAEEFYLFWQEFFNKTTALRRPGRMLYSAKTSYYLMGFDMTLYYHKKNQLIYNLIGDPETIIPAQDFIDSKPLAIPTSIDGYWGGWEWQDSEELYLYHGTKVPFSYYYNVKNDQNWLYISVDAWGDRTYNASDYCLLVFDTGHNNVLTVGSEDAIIIFGDGRVQHRLYNGVNWATTHCSSTSGVPFTDHGRNEAGMIGAVKFSGGREVYEFKIPLALGDLNALPGQWQRMDMEMYDYDDGFSYWPADCSWPNPKTWGDLQLAYPYNLADFPAPFIHQKGCYYLGDVHTTFVVGGTHPHGPFSWGAWTVDVLGGIGMASTLGRDATGNVQVAQAVDDDVADYNPGPGTVTIDWSKITTKTVISIGSGAVNLVSLNYNATLPFKFVKKGWDVSIYSQPSGKSYGSGYGYDHFVIALVYEPAKGYVLVSFGITGQGSQAASLILQNYKLFGLGTPYPQVLQGKAVLVKWQDLNGNNMPDLGDKYTPMESVA